MTQERPVRKRRRWWIVAAAAAIVVVGLVAALPWLLGTPPARRWLLSRADRALAPGGLAFDSIRASWFGPTRMTGVVLRDREGDRVVAASRATWDRNLWQILFDRPRFGTLVLDGADLDLERAPDGSVDLYETIKPVLRMDPRTALKVVFEGGRLRFRGAGMPEPVTADRADLTLDIQAAPGPVAWQLRMRKGPAAPGQEAVALEITGRYDRWQPRPAGAPADLAVELAGRRWPWALDRQGWTARGALDGDLAVRRRSGRWGLSGKARLGGLDAAGPGLAGDHLRLDSVDGVWDLAQAANVWQIRRLELISPIGSIRADGTLPAPSGGTARLVGTLDLAALAAQLPHALRLREGIALDQGAASIRVEARTGSGAPTWDIEAKVSDLRARDRDRAFTLQEPATLAARLTRPGEAWAVERLAVKTAFLDASAWGDLDRGVAWSGTLDLGGLRRQLRDLVDLGGVELEGRGDVSGSYRRAGAAFEARIAADLHDLRAAGLGLGPGPIRRDAARLDLVLGGPATASGLPQSWRDLKLGVHSGAVTADLAATPRDGGHDLTATARAPLTLLDRKHQAEARLIARWEGSGASIDRLRVALLPDEGAKEPKAEPLALEVRGRYDRERGEIVLSPVSGARGDRAIALAPDGVRVVGIGRPGGLKATAALVGDVAALRPMVATPADLAGTWSARATAQATDEGLQLGGRLDLTDLSRPGPAGQGRRAEGPIAVSMKGLYRGDADRLDLAELVLASRYATLEAAGTLAELGGRRLADLKGTLTPDWKAINGLLADRVEPGARVSGKPRPAWLSGALGAGSADEVLRSLDGEVGVDMVAADLYGMHVGPAPIVFRPRQGRLVLDPIDTTINNGRLHLEPELTFDGDRGATLRLEEASTITDAEINDEVSHRVLSYVAPVLDRATRAHGRVSVELDAAAIPLGGDPGRSTTVDGDVVFQDVEFLAGPLADQLLRLIGRDDRPLLKLDEPVALKIADRRVYQQGLALPLGRVSRIELQGWVDFDRNLAMTASLPLTPAMVGNLPILNDIVEGTRITVPIRGTLQHPEIDKDAMNLVLQDLVKTLGRGATRGAADLLMRLTRPRDPNAPPPPTREERRARRKERQAQRRLNRGIVP